MSGSRLIEWRGSRRLSEHDLADLHGVPDVKYALEVAAAGGHHVMLSGPKGAGKTSLAERLPGILPDLSVEESLELTAIHSLAGALEPGDELIVRPPFFAPHHDASKASLLGGGTGRVRPGEVSRSHCGVLFLDEFPLFRADVIDALRQPLESGEVTIARGEESATFPARGMVVMACNPCPCGEYTPARASNHCTCTQQQRHHYSRRVTGPVHDRIDILRHVLPPASEDAQLPGGRRESSPEVRERVAAARERQAVRYAGREWRLNSQVPSAILAREWPLPDAGATRLEREVLDGHLSRRGAVRVHRLAWTVADLRGRDRPTVSDLDTALPAAPGRASPAGDGRPEGLMSDDDRLARVALSRLTEPGDPQDRVAWSRSSAPSRCASCSATRPRRRRRLATSRAGFAVSIPRPTSRPARGPACGTSSPATTSGRARSMT